MNDIIEQITDMYISSNMLITEKRPGAVYAEFLLYNRAEWLALIGMHETLAIYEVAVHIFKKK